MNKKILCIYHHGCSDGFAAAWAVRKYHGASNVDFHAGIYGDAPPDCTGRNVVLVDFSYKRDVMLEMIGQAASVLVIDHHKTAEAELVNLPAKARTIFDMNRSGAMLTWETLFTGQMPPLLFDHIQDRDLWQFKLPMTREITAALYSYPMDFETWDFLIAALPIKALEQEGRAILRKHNADIAAIIRSATRTVRFGTLMIPAANVPWMYASDVGHELSKGQLFAATYYDDATGRRWSLRSAPDGLDVSLIAEAFGGGGHKHAAGFHMTHEQAIEFEMGQSDIAQEGDIT